MARPLSLSLPLPLASLLPLGLLLACDGGGSQALTTDAAPTGDAASTGDTASTDAAAPSTPGSAPFSDTCAFTGSPGHQVRTWGSSGAELEGPQLGDGALDTTNLRKLITVSAPGLVAPFTLGQAYLMRDSLDSIGLDFIAQVRFMGTGTACQVSADIIWRAADGTVVAEPGEPERELAFLTGSVGMVGGRITTGSCLSSGESGYFIDLRLSFQNAASLYDRVSSAELHFRSYSVGAPSMAAVHATSYVGCQASRQIEVALESRGPQAAVFERDNLGRYLLSDDGGAPLAWGLLGTRRGLGSYAPGKSIVGGDLLLYEGSSRHMQVFADFEVSLLFAAAAGDHDQAAPHLQGLQLEQRQFAFRQRARWQAIRDARPAERR